MTYAELPDNAPDAPAASDTSWMEPLACLLQQDDPFLSHELPKWIKTTRCGPHDGLFWQPSVQERVWAMDDGYLTSLVLTLARPDYLGLEFLFDERLLPRLAAMREAHFQGTFLPYARRMPDFSKAERAWCEKLAAAAQGAYALLIHGTDLKEEAIDWLWEPYIAKKTLTIIDGDPGVGKTILACQLAASVSRGYPFPDQVGHMTMGSPDPGEVLMVGMEDHLNSVVLTRLRLCQADMDHLTFCNDKVDADGLPLPVTLEDLPLIEEYMQGKRPTLVYIDAIQSVLGGKVDIGSPNKIKALLGPLERLAQDYQCAIVCSRHPSKPGQNVPRLIHRGMGSQSFIGSARSGLFVEEDPGEKTRSLLVHYKSNMGALGRTQIFSKAQGEFRWCGVTRVGEAVLVGSGRGPHPYALLEACFLLERELAGGRSRPSTEIEAVAEDAEIAESVLKRAKKVLGVQSTQISGTAHAGWLWYLPPLTAVAVQASRGGMEREDGTQSSEHTDDTEASEPTEYSDLESTTYRDTASLETETAVSETHVPARTQVSGDSEGSEESVWSETSGAQEAPPQKAVPCVICGHTARWNDHGIWRCTRCWPTTRGEGG